MLYIHCVALFSLDASVELQAVLDLIMSPFRLRFRPKIDQIHQA
jgi:hypothetical protein